MLTFKTQRIQTYYCNLYCKKHQERTNMLHIKKQTQRRINYIFSSILMSALILILIEERMKLLTKEYKEDIYILPSFGEFEKSRFINNSNERYFIIPDIVHFLRFNQPEFTFMEASCILSVVRNHMPQNIYIHTDLQNFTGKYWEYLLKNKHFNKIYKIKYISIPSSIFQQDFDENYFPLHHGSDVTRLRILRQYGGIFLDNDSYVIKSLDKFRRMEISVGWDQFNKNIGTQILVAHPDARFLQLWLESYRDHYKPKLWYYNAGDRPYQTVLIHKPNLIHNATKEFGVYNMCNSIYRSYWKTWRSYYAIHLLENHRDYLDPTYKIFKKLNDKNVCLLRNTVGEMLRMSYFGNNICPGKMGKIQKLRQKKLPGSIKKSYLILRKPLKRKLAQ